MESNNWEDGNLREGVDREVRKRDNNKYEWERGRENLGLKTLDGERDGKRVSQPRTYVFYLK